MGMEMEMGMGMGISQQTSQKVALLVSCFQVKLESELLVFLEKGKLKDPEYRHQNKDRN